jgi:hypothetical protein
MPIASAGFYSAERVRPRRDPVAARPLAGAGSHLCLTRMPPRLRHRSALVRRRTLYSTTPSRLPVWLRKRSTRRERLPSRGNHEPPASSGNGARHHASHPAGTASDTDVDASDVLDAPLPALLKGYVRLGAVACGEPCRDPDFEVADVLMLLDMRSLNPSYARHFLERI